MKFEALQTLNIVIREGSFAQAAPILNITPSAVGLQMRQLEEYFGRPLFDRSGRQVRPTEFARQVAATVSETLTKVEGLRLHDQLAVAGQVRLGIIETTMSSVLPKAILRLRQLAPGLEIQITRGVSQWLQQEIKAGRLDMAVVVRPPRVDGRRLHWMPLYLEDFVLVAPPDSVGQSAASLLRRHEWIRFNRNATGGKIAADFVDKVVPGKKHILELPGTDAIIACVANGLGVSVIPSPRPELARAYLFRQIGLGTSRLQREIALVCRSSDKENRRILAVQRAFSETVDTARLFKGDV